MALDLFGRPVDLDRKIKGNLNVRLEEADWDRLIYLKHQWEMEEGCILTVTEVTRAALLVAENWVKKVLRDRELAAAVAAPTADPVPDPPPTPPPAPPSPQSTLKRKARKGGKK